MVQAVQQQPEELLGIMLAAITKVSTHRELSNALKEVSWIHSILVALGIHLQPCHISTTTQAVLHNMQPTHTCTTLSKTLKTCQTKARDKPCVTAHRTVKVVGAPVTCLTSVLNDSAISPFLSGTRGTATGGGCLAAVDWFGGAFSESSPGVESVVAICCAASPGSCCCCPCSCCCCCCCKSGCRSPAATGLDVPRTPPGESNTLTVWLLVSELARLFKLVPVRRSGERFGSCSWGEVSEQL